MPKIKKRIRDLIPMIMIYSQYIGMECSEMIMKMGKRKMTEEREVPNAESIWINRKWQILESEHHHTIRNEKKVRDNHLWSPPSKILWTILKVDREGTQTNGPKNKKMNDDVQSLTPERWHWPIHKKSKERLIVATSKNNNNIRTIKENKISKTQMERKIT